MATKLYILNDKDNPVRRARGKHSRAEFAADADVSANYIKRVELGLANTLTPSILRAIAEYEGGTEEDWVNTWEEWQYHRRVLIAEEMKSWWDLTSSLTKRFFTYNFFRDIARHIVGSGSDYSVARVFSLHPTTWEQYLARDNPQAFDTVLSQCVEDIIFAVNER